VSFEQALNWRRQSGKRGQCGFLDLFRGGGVLGATLLQLKVSVLTSARNILQANDAFVAGEGVQGQVQLDILPCGESRYHWHGSWSAIVNIQTQRILVDESDRLDPYSSCWPIRTFVSIGHSANGAIPTRFCVTPGQHTFSEMVPGGFEAAFGSKRSP
jgi:hypothetical protein